MRHTRQNVTLQCGVSYDPRVHNETEVSWNKDGDILGKILRNTQKSDLIRLEKAKYYFSQLLSDTTVAKHSMQPDWSLKMSNLTLSDNGIYTCEVATPFETITSQIAVRVSGEPPRILSDFKKIVVYEGESLEIRCLVRGVPRPALTWYVVSLSANVLFL